MSAIVAGTLGHRRAALVDAVAESESTGASSLIHEQTKGTGTRLFRLEHSQGFGDAIALTAVLRHLRYYYPGCRIELVVKPGRERLYGPELADEVSTSRDLRRRPTHVIDWKLANQSYSRHPSTYVERCLIEQFHLQPIDRLCRYGVDVADEDRLHARQYLASVVAGTDTRYALCHFRGHAMKDRKDIDDYEAAAICGVLQGAGYTVLVWDANDRTTLPEEQLGIRVPPSTAYRLPSTYPDAGRLAGLVAECDLFVGICSGPLHLAAALGADPILSAGEARAEHKMGLNPSVRTPSVRAIGLWTRESPLHGIAPADHVFHLCRKNGRRQFERHLIRRHIDVGLKYFRAHYRHAWCDDFADGLGRHLSSDFRPLTSDL